MVYYTRVSEAMRRFDFSLRYYCDLRFIVAVRLCAPAFVLSVERH